MLWFLFLALFGLSPPAGAQKGVQFEHVSAEHRLSNDAVYCITQDRHGFIWIGTEDGLNRFDGQEMVVFRHDAKDPGSISYNWVRALHEDYLGRLWVGYNNGLDRLDPLTGRFESTQQFSRSDTTMNLGLIKRISEDKTKGMWFAGSQIIHFDPNSQVFSSFPVETMETKQAEIQFLGKNDQGTLVAGNLNGLFNLDTTSKAFQPLVKTGVRGGRFDEDGNLWIVGLYDLMRLNWTDRVLDTMVAGLFSQLGYLVPREIVMEEERALWVGGSDLGLIRIDPGSDRIDAFRHDPQDNNSLATGIGTSLFIDRDGSLWVGGVNGLDRLPARSLNGLGENAPIAQFDHRQVVPDASASLDQKMIRCFLKDRKGFFWVGTYDGIYKFRQHGRELEWTDHLTHDPDDAGTLSSKEIRMLVEDRQGDIWVSTRQGLNRIDSENGQVERIYFEGFELNGLSEEVFWSLCQDGQGHIWIGTEKSGLLKLDPDSREVQRYFYDPTGTFYSENTIVKIFQDRSGRIWVGTYGGGLNLYDPSSDDFIRFMPGNSATTSISGDNVWAIFEDAQERLWIGTQNGLDQLIMEGNPEEASYRFEHYSEIDGLINNTIYGIEQDKLGRLWISTIDGLSCFDPAAKTFFNPGPVDGLTVQSFTPDAQFTDPLTGELFLGGVNGFVRFQPTRFQADTLAPPVVISSLTRFNKRESQGNPIIDYFVADKRSFEFSYLDDIIIFNLALLNYEQNEKNQYEYRLEGLHAHWVPLGTDKKITLTELNTGNYTLRIRGTNHHGVLTKQETKISLTVIPPWWWTTLAKVIYVLLLFAGILGIYRYEVKKKLVQQEARQLKELDQVKSRFFTNISHEFRTPLTIISGMATQVKKDPDQWLEKGMELIQRNSNHMLSLINQILDLRKLESGTLKIHRVRGNIIPYLHYLADSFVPLAQSKDIRIHFLSAVQDLEMDYDPDKMLQILSNLLSNAIKYTPGPGDIYVQVDHLIDPGREQLTIRIKDTGKGIHPDALPHIFEQFYQVEDLATQKRQGSGVGLALVKELVKLQKGSIEAVSELGVGTTFLLSFPISREASVQAERIGSISVPMATTADVAPLHRATDSEASRPEKADHATIPSHPAGKEEDRPSLLIVEDNADVRLYLTTCLKDTYHLLLASDGQEGIDLATEAVPDLIVSDVMMPVKDGFTLCDTLKKDERTSHIPIILLTAKADLDSRLSGLRKGADAYLPKPFEQEELLVRLEQLLLLRKKLQVRYQHGKADNEDAATANAPLEDAFIEKLRQEVMGNLLKKDFGVVHLQRALGISRTQLHRKIKALTGQSTTEFVRMIRLQKARELLQSTNLNVSEVSYEVGIDNPAYFSRIYSEAFGEPPSETRK